MILQQQVIQTTFSKVLRPTAHLIRPSDDKTYPGIVMIQEWWGIEPHVLATAMRLAREGFAVIVPDLYHGEVTSEPDDAKKLLMGTFERISEVLTEVTQACDYMRNNMGVSPKKLGIMGFCMGGNITYRMAERYPHFGAVSPWYGGGYAPSADDIKNVNAPVLAMYGEDDGGIPLTQVRHIESVFAAAGKPAEFRVYKGAGHAFLNPDHGAFHAASADDAWTRVVAFFKQHLNA
jgi:carboxymethylenebutenolidase